MRRTSHTGRMQKQRSSHERSTAIKMADVVVAGAALSCSFGAAPGNLVVTNQTSLLVEGKPAATIQDCQGNVNIVPFGMCSSMLNPQVAAATAAALGVLTPQPCMMMPAGVWRTEGTAILAAGKPVLTQKATLTCAAGMGSISIVSKGQTTIV